MAPVLRQDAHGDERATAEARAVGDAAAGKLPVAPCEQQDPIQFHRRAELGRGHGLVRDDGALQRRPRREVGVGGDRPQLDHPERFNFPCCLA
jgi:hypothetical protein